MIPVLDHCLLCQAVLVLSILLSAQATGTCYREDNHTASASIYTPCNYDQPFSMCYRSQVDIYGNPADQTCLPNGLSQNVNVEGGYEYWRQSCTDPTWQSPYCLNAFDYCPSDSDSNAQVSPCGNDAASTTWCCGANNTRCCDTPEVITIAPIIGASNNELSTGAKAGIGLGVAIGAFTVLVLGWMVVRTRKWEWRDRRNVGKSGGNELAGSEVYPVRELDVESECQALYKANGPHDGIRCQEAPVEMSAYAPVEMSSHTPVEMSVSTPVEMSAQTPVREEN